MPVANGYEICAQLRRAKVLSETPVLILTGRDGAIDRVRANLAGATGFVSKTAGAEALVAAIARRLATTVPVPPLPPTPQQLAGAYN